MFKKITASENYDKEKFINDGFSFFSLNSKLFIDQTKKAHSICDTYINNYSDRRFINKDGYSRHFGNPHYNHKIFYNLMFQVVKKILENTFKDKNFYITHSKISYKTPGINNNWYPHQDNGYKSKSFKGFSAAIFLEDSNEINGSLELFSKSHNLGTLEHELKKDKDGTTQLSLKHKHDETPHLLDAKAGDVAIWNLDTIHQSRNNQSNNNRFILIFEVFEIGQLNKFITLDEERRVPILISKNFTWISFLYKILNNIQKPYFFIKKKFKN